jgi:hypothetical protein
MENVSWTDRVRNEVLHRVKVEINTLHAIIRRKANWIGHILRRDYLLKHVIERKIEGMTEVTVKQGRKPTQRLDDLNQTRILKTERGNIRSHSVQN